MSYIESLLNRIECNGIDNDNRVVERKRKYFNITKDTGEFLAVMVKSISANKILEVGTSNGYSTLWLANALEADGLVTTIENNPQKIKEAKENFSQARLNKKIEILEGEASEIITNLRAGFDLVFLDADRSIYLDIKEDVIRLTRPGGVIICDNAISHSDELTAFMDYFRNLKSFSSCLVPVGKGEFVVYKSTKTI